MIKIWLFIAYLLLNDFVLVFSIKNQLMVPKLLSGGGGGE